MGIGRSYAGVAIIDKPLWRSPPAGDRVHSDENSHAEGAGPNIYETIDPTASSQEAENIYETIEEPPPPPPPPLEPNPELPSCSNTYGRIGNTYGRIDIIGHGIGRIERHLSSSCGSINSNHYAIESLYGTVDTSGRISKVSVQWLLANKWLPLWIANTQSGRDYRIIDFLLAQRAESEESLQEEPQDDQGPSQT